MDQKKTTVQQIYQFIIEKFINNFQSLSVMVYDVGSWTHSTLRTLVFIEEQNASGKKPRLKDILNGTFRNWIYALLKGNYVTYQEGFILTEKGKMLLKELKTNPPQDRRNMKRNNEKRVLIKNQDHSKSFCEVTVRSEDMIFKTIITTNEAKDIIKAIQDIKGKK